MDQQDAHQDAARARFMALRHTGPLSIDRSHDFKELGVSESTRRVGRSLHFNRFWMVDDLQAIDALASKYWTAAADKFADIGRWKTEIPRQFN